MEAPGRRTITLQVQVGGVVIAGYKAPLAGLAVLPILGPELLQLVCQLAHAQRLGVVGRLACSSDNRTVITCLLSDGRLATSRACSSAAAYRLKA